MHEMDAILEAWGGGGGHGGGAVIATVAHVTGSAYRRPGARMLIFPDGRRVGSISGGCLEGEITKKAWWFTESGDPVVKVYDTTSDDDAVWEFGLGCNGVVHVLLERADSPAAARLLRFLDGCRRDGAPAVVATLIRRGTQGAVGDRLLLRRGRAPEGELLGTEIGEVLWPHLEATANARESRLVRLDAPCDAEVFVEWVGRPRELVVFGAGHDAVPLVSMAKTLGWQVTVADGRPAYASREHFPSADRVVVMRPGRLLDGVAIGAETAVVMMTHNYPLDRRLLPAVLECRPQYLGMLGPASRTSRLFGELGIEHPDCVRAPVGLNIGCDTPASIALSIVAEVQACFSGRAGGPLTAWTGPIHAPAVVVGSGGSWRHEAGRPAFCESVVGSNV